MEIGGNGLHIRHFGCFRIELIHTRVSYPAACCEVVDRRMTQRGKKERPMTMSGKPEKTARKEQNRKKAVLRRMALPLLLVSALLLASSCAQGSITTSRYALIIGISNYKNLSDEDNLTYPVVDAESMENLLEEQHWTVETLKDAEASESGIKSAIHDFFAGIPPTATALIYYSGHGTLVNGGYSGDPAIVPYDLDSTTWTPLITADDLSTWISDYIPTKNVIVILDSCYSGGFVDSGDSSDTISSSYSSQTSGSVTALPLSALTDFGSLLVKNAEATGGLVPIVISAAGSAEYSYEDPAASDPESILGLAHGVFTYYLLESATEGDSNGDGYVSCTEAYTYTAKAIDKYWNGSVGRWDSFYPHISGGLRDLVLFTDSD